MPEWRKGAVCKIAGLRLRWFESNSAHHLSRLEIHFIINTIMKQQHDSKLSDSLLIEEYNSTKHIGKIAAKFNLPHITIWRRLKRLDVKIEADKSGKEISLDEILRGEHPYFQTYKLNKKLIKAKIFESKCAECGITDWNNKPLNMQLDHINGCSNDHRLENLRLLCANCHSQTDTFCGKNK